MLRGPAVLLYGSSAIGGAVNVIDKRIPRRVPARAGAPRCQCRGSTPPTTCARAGPRSMRRSAASSPLHVDGSYRTTDDVEIPGFVASEPLRRELFAEAAAESRRGRRAARSGEPARRAARQRDRDLIRSAAGSPRSARAPRLGVSVGLLRQRLRRAHPRPPHEAGEAEEEAVRLDRPRAVARRLARLGRARRRASSRKRPRAGAIPTTPIASSKATRSAPRSSSKASRAGSS